MDNFQIAREWFNIAEMDIASAKYLQNMRPVPVEIICYHCQQSSEKFLKGFLSACGHEITKTHDLILLNKICQKYYVEFKSIEEECLRLTDYGVNIRYPYPMELNETDLKIAIKDAGKIKIFVIEKIKSIKSGK